MENFKRTIMISLCALVLSNCSARRELVSLPPSLQKEIGSTDIYVEESQKKLLADIESSNISTYSGGGLLFALVDCAIMSHREGCVEDAMIEIQKDFAAVNIQEKFKSKLIPVFKGANWLHAQQVNFVKEINKDNQEEILKKAQTDSVLISKLIYKFNPDLSVLKGTLFVTVYPTSIKLKNLVKTDNPQGTPIFTFKVSAAKALPENKKDMPENAKMWVQHNGNILKDALEEILQQVSINTEKVLKDPTHLPEG